MAYVEPTAATFKARFPEFAPVSDALVNLILAETIPQAGETWLERDRAPAQMYLAAHMLTIEGEPDRSVSGTGIGLSGPVKRYREGDVETEFATTGQSSSSGGVGGYQSTSYGQVYERLLRLNFAGPQIIA